MKLVKYIPILFLLIGLSITGRSVYYYAKGYTANYLLEKAWEKSKSNGSPILPWAWADTYPIGKLSIPAINLETVVLKGLNNESLAFGAAHVPNTTWPGLPGNVAIAGHRDSFFRKLKNIQTNDLILLESFDKVQQFKTSSTYITSPEDTSCLDNIESDCLTLITCYPFDFIGSAPQRFIVRAYKK